MAEKALTLLRSWLRGFGRQDQAVTAVEYAILTALIIVVAIGSISLIGQRFFNLYVLIAAAVGGTI